MIYGLTKTRDENNAGHSKSQGGDHPGVQSRICRGNQRGPETAQLHEGIKWISLERINQAGRTRTNRRRLDFNGVCRAAGEHPKKTAQHIRQATAQTNKKFKPETRQTSRNFGGLQRVQIGQPTHPLPNHPTRAFEAATRLHGAPDLIYELA